MEEESETNEGVGNMARSRQTRADLELVCASLGQARANLDTLMGVLAMVQNGTLVVDDVGTRSQVLNGIKDNILVMKTATAKLL